MVSADTAIVLSQISSLTKLVRTTWLGILFACSYTWVVVVIEIIPDSKTGAVLLKLPFLNTEILPEDYYFSAPLIIVIINIYFQILVGRLWRLYSFLPSIHKGMQLDDIVEPWLGVNALPNSSHPEFFSSIARLAGLLFIVLFPLWAVAAVGGNYVFPNNKLLFWHALLISVSISTTFVTFRYISYPLPVIRSGLKISTNSKYAAIIFGFSFFSIIGVSTLSNSRLWHINTWNNLKVNISNFQFSSVVESETFDLYDDARNKHLNMWCKNARIDDCDSMSQSDRLAEIFDWITFRENTLALLGV